MPLILAIESDHRQAGHLVQIVKRRLGAELILAQTFDAALPAIGNRVPDLILVPALLSAEDDSALKFVLRVLSDSSHVQVLSTPVFAGSRSEPSRLTLSGLLRTRKKSAAAGCDPEEFARHVASYLQEAAEKRAIAQPRVVGPAVLEYDAVAPAPTPPAKAGPPVWPVSPVEEAPVPEPIDFSAPVASVDTTTETDWPVDPVSIEVSVVDVQPRKPPVVVDNDALDRLAANLNLLFSASEGMRVGGPVKPVAVRESIARPDNYHGSAAPAPTLEQLALDADSRQRGDIEPRPQRVEPHAGPNSTGDEWGLFDPKYCGLEALLVRIKDIRQV